jgi:hypothetical protein
MEDDELLDPELMGEDLLEDGDNAFEEPVA